MTDLTRAGRTVGTVTAVPASTVLLVRQGDGVEVFLQERTLASDFAGGAYVFPGGKVDPRDHAIDPQALGTSDVRGLVASFGGPTPQDTRALAVAAIRETFEEAGVLLATHDRRPLSAEEVSSPSFLEARAGLAERGRDYDWRPFLAEHGLVLDLQALAPFAWWITPHGVFRRFSTRFFLAAVPPLQVPLLGHDGLEMTDSLWLRPAVALAAAEAGERTIIFPTRRTLMLLAEFDTVAEAMAAARGGQVDLRPILPLLRRIDGVTRVQHPDGGPLEDV